MIQVLKQTLCIMGEDPPASPDVFVRVLPVTFLSATLFKGAPLD